MNVFEELVEAAAGVLATQLSTDPDNPEIRPVILGVCGDALTAALERALEPDVLEEWYKAAFEETNPSPLLHEYLRALLNQREAGDG